MLTGTVRGKKRAIAVQTEFITCDGDSHVVRFRTANAAFKFARRPVPQPNPALPEVPAATLSHTWAEVTREMRRDAHEWPRRGVRSLAILASIPEPPDLWKISGGH